MKPLRILIVDDHALVREGLRRLLATFPDVTAVGTAADGREAIEAARRTRPDVILLDVAMPHLDGLSAIAPLRETAPEAAILVLSMHDESAYEEAARDRGACGLLSKAASPEALHRAILDASAGRTLPVTSPLTPRERKVLSCLASEASDETIARALGIRPRTVEKHCQRMMKALEIRTRAGLVSYARRCRRPPLS